MRKSPGDKVPSFSVFDILGNEHSSEKYIGKQWMLSFFRYASCPACNLRIHELTKVYDELQQNGIQILTVFESPKTSILDYVSKDELPFPIIPDPDRKLYKLFGVESSWLKFIFGLPTVVKGVLNGFFPGKMEGDLAIIPADFLIGKNGIIQKAYYGKNFGDHIPTKEINSFSNYYDI